MQALVYTPAMQGQGEFDGGNIKEQKPIGFPGEGSVVKRVGPLFYWAWATSSADGLIGWHPHKGFEIMTYVIAGAGHHEDSLGTRSTVGAGGAQVMQTGSGVSHQERVDAGSELFQIWFEPDLAKAFSREPTYRQHAHEDFPSEALPDGTTVKRVIGDGAPVEVVTDVRMWDVIIGVGAEYRQRIGAGRTLTALAVRGQGAWGSSDADRPPEPFRHKDFIVSAAGADTEAVIANTGEVALRLVLIEVPSVVNYALYPKR